MTAPRLRRSVACPAALKGTLSAAHAAAALAKGMRRAGLAADEVPVADGGEGTADALRASLGGKWRSALVPDPLGRTVDARFLLLPDGRAVVESAEAIGLRRLRPGELDPLRASSRGLGELVRAALAEGATGLVVGLGDSATVDGGNGLREAISGLPVDTVVACDVANTLLGERGAARAFGPQKGASRADVEALEQRLAAMGMLSPFAEIPGAGAAGGLGAAFAAMGARLLPGAELVVEAVGLRDRLRGAAFAVTGEGTVDTSSTEGKASGRVAALCSQLGVRCLVFGGRVERAVPGAETVTLSGDPASAEADLEELGYRLGTEA